MAHDWVMKYGKVDSNYNRENTVQLAWEYADAMQAEADKRMVKLPDVFFDTKQNHIKQAKIDELQGRIDDASNKIDFWVGGKNGDAIHVAKSIGNILKGNKDEN